MDAKLKKSPKTQARHTDTLMQFAVSPSRKSQNVATVKNSGFTTRVVFGLVSLQVEPQAPSRLRSNIVQGQQALARARDKILSPGIKMMEKKGIPLFSADPKCPDLLIRKLDGKIQRGTITNGKFKAIKSSGAVKTAKAA